MENKKTIISILLFFAIIISCHKNGVIDSSEKNNNDYIKVNEILYKNNNDYYFKYNYPTRVNDKISDSYAYENKILNVEDSSIQELTKIININSFKLLKFPYYIDNKNVYVVNNYAGSPACSYYSVDLKTLRITGTYISDINNVYYYSKKVEKADPKSFNSKIFNTEELPIELGFDNSSLFIQESKLDYSQFKELEMNTNTKDSLKAIYFRNK